jgi:hypothetical protein
VVALTTQRMKDPGQNTEASSCQVRVSRVTMAPRFTFWDSSVEWRGGEEAGNREKVVEAGRGKREGEGEERFSGVWEVGVTS